MVEVVKPTKEDVALTNRHHGTSRRSARSGAQAISTGPPRDKKYKLKAASSLMNTIRYHAVVGSGRTLKDTFADAVVIRLLPDPNRPEQWTDQATVFSVNREEFTL
jgi:hypothetical protein